MTMMLAGLRPDGGASLVFTPTINPLLQPSANHEAATVNLFYWNNVLHDVLYQYGFDEAAGNFQQNNYGNGGIGGDAVRADSQDGSGVNNATFATAAGRHTGAHANVLMGARCVVEFGNYRHSRVSPAIMRWVMRLSEPGQTGLVGSVVLALDDSNTAGPSSTDGCTSFTQCSGGVGQYRFG